MLKISKRVLFSGLITVGLITLVLILTGVLNVDISRRIEKIEESRMEQRAFGNSVALFGTLMKQEGIIGDLEAHLAKVLPNRDALVTFPRKMELVAIEYDLGYGFSFGTEEIGDIDNPGKILYILSLSGEMENILGFLEEFEAHPYITSMQSMNINQRVMGGFAFRAEGEIFIQ